MGVGVDKILPIALTYLLSFLYEKIITHFKPYYLSHGISKTGRREVVLLLSWRPGELMSLSQATFPLVFEIDLNVKRLSQTSWYLLAPENLAIKTSLSVQWNAPCFGEISQASSPRFTPQDSLKPGISLSGAQFIFSHKSIVG